MNEQKTMLKKRLREILSPTLSKEALNFIYNSYDIVGDIAIVRLTNSSERYGEAIAETIMKVHKNVKTVLAQTTSVHGDFRLRELKYIAGENKTTTFHRESRCLFLVDVKRCYFSPRLFYERMRIAKQVKPGEIVLNMFAGVGCFSIVIAVHSAAMKIYSIDINPIAVQFMQENVKLNRVYARVIPIFGDAKEVISKKLRHVADRVLMPLPEKAFNYLPFALSSLKKTGGWIHYYDFEHFKKGENPVEKTRRKVSEELEKLRVSFKIPYGRIVRSVGPNWFQTVLDIKVA